MYKDLLFHRNQGPNVVCYITKLELQRLGSTRIHHQLVNPLHYKLRWPPESLASISQGVCSVFCLQVWEEQTSVALSWRRRSSCLLPTFLRVQSVWEEEVLLSLLRSSSLLALLWRYPSQTLRILLRSVSCPPTKESQILSMLSSFFCVLQSDLLQAVLVQSSSYSRVCHRRRCCSAKCRVPVWPELVGSSSVFAVAFGFWSRCPSSSQCCWCYIPRPLKKCSNPGAHRQPAERHGRRRPHPSLVDDYQELLLLQRSRHSSGSRLLLFLLRFAPPRP